MVNHPGLKPFASPSPPKKSHAPAALPASLLFSPLTPFFSNYSAPLTSAAYGEIKTNKNQ